MMFLFLVAKTCNHVIHVTSVIHVIHVTSLKDELWNGTKKLKESIDLHVLVSFSYETNAIG